MSLTKRLDAWEKSENGQRIIKNAVLSLFAAFNVCFFTPMDFYLSHAFEISFPINPAGSLAVVTAVAFAAVMAACSLTKGKIGAAVRFVVFSVSLAFYIQGNFLAVNMGELDGSRYSIPVWRIILNIALWLIILAAPFFFAKKHSKAVNDAVYYVSGAVLAIQIITLFISFTVLRVNITSSFAVDEDIFDHSERYVCTSKDLKKYGKDKNFIIILTDEYGSSAFDEASEASPEALSEFDGFTYYKNTSGMYGFTEYAIHYIFTGEKKSSETPYDNREFFDKVKAGYKTDIYSATGVFPEDILKDYAENYILRKVTFEDIYAVDSSLYKVTFFRCMPEILKNLFLIYGDEIGQICDPSGGSTNYYPDNLAFYNSINGDFDFTDESCFKFIYLYGLHLPRNITEDLDRRTGGESSPKEQAVAVNKILNEYFAALKENGIYDNSDILVLADHGMKDSGSVKYPLLMYKPAHRTETGIKVSNAPISHEDLYPTLLKLAGGEPAERTIFDIGEDEQRTRYFDATDEKITDSTKLPEGE